MHGLTLEQQVRLLTGADFWALHPEPAAGLRRVVTSDGPAGVRGERWDEREPSANVPSPTALAATWDEPLIGRLAGLLAAECVRKGIDVLLAPTVNLHRTPYGGRHFECLSEDPLLTGRIGAAYVRGLQAYGVGATVKHFVANDSETERFTLDARIDERTLRELYLAPFEHIVREARPWAVMAAYNGVNGHTMTESPLIEEVLRGEWGFDGVVMSDWFAARSTEAAALAGLDLVMPGPDGPWGDALVAAVREGLVPAEVVAAKVERILELAQRTAHPHPPEVDPEPLLREVAAAGTVLARNEGRLLPLDRARLGRVAVIGPNAAAARTLGGGSATVFPPHAVSPLAGLRAAGLDVVHAPGPRAHTRLPVADPAVLERLEVRFLDADGALLGTEERSGASLAWQGTQPAATTAVELHARLRAHTGGTHTIGASGTGRLVLTVDGRPAFDEPLTLGPGADLAEAHMRPPQHRAEVHLEAGATADVVLRFTPENPKLISLQLNHEPPHPPDDEALAGAVAAAAAADVAIVVVGTSEEVESEGFDRESLALPGRQDELVRRVAAANPRTVVVVNSGAPVLLPWADDVPAILLAWFGGQEMGHALAAVLLGDDEPGGRLPTTWPRSERGLPSTQPVDGVLEYAEGLRVGYRDPDRDVLFGFGHGLGYTGWAYEALDAGAGDSVSVTVRNIGDRRGREVVQVYGRDRLVAFGVARADPGEAVTVSLDLPDRALADWDPGAHAFAVPPGEISLHSGGLTTRRPTR
ncbi:MAG: beta-glucosidase [Solirubrobacteraceae bacterium]|nr:beta-glucosidase [Solirubrobacteraceae bacterium]